TVVAALAAPALASACAGADVTPSSKNVTTARAATLCLLNEQRKAHGLGRLRAHRMLQSAAQRYAGQMVKGRFFDHVSPTGSTLEQRIRENTRYLAGALRYDIGENIAWGQGALAKPRAIVSAWMASPGHRANILRAAFREIGIGIAPGAPVAGLRGDQAVTYTNEFGARR
ncbi:MAG: hypothetical protein QOG77_2314, partial [Solirubrobacteraceae bacterium]|nr:hypothetical protein [Solirubrobacteraceae bacterium]